MGRLVFKCTLFDCSINKIMKCSFCRQFHCEVCSNQIHPSKEHSWNKRTRKQQQVNCCLSNKQSIILFRFGNQFSKTNIKVNVNPLHSEHSMMRRSIDRTANYCSRAVRLFTSREENLENRAMDERVTLIHSFLPLRETKTCYLKIFLWIFTSVTLF